MKIARPETSPRQHAGPGGADARFPKARRVRRPREFKQVFERGTRVQGRFFTLLVLPNGGNTSRLGIVASRKFGGAVQRNRAKRLIRELFRQHAGRHGGRPVDAVIIPRRELLDASFQSITRDFLHVWRRGAERMSSDARA